uniref:Uncharacterized protein n=1 Tax=Anguilla anguilla TaxID=7936 RepID=A0A0E9TRL0_ANGAN
MENESEPSPGSLVWMMLSIPSPRPSEESPDTGTCDTCKKMLYHCLSYLRFLDLSGRGDAPVLC